jgi:hypothetical protein
MRNSGSARSIYSFISFGARPLFRYLLLVHRTAFVQTLAAIGLTPDDVLHGNRILSEQEQAAIFGLACQLRMNDPLLAFRAAQLHDIHDSGLPGILARSCGTFREMVEIHEKYYFKLDSEGVLARASYTQEEIAFVSDKLAYAPIAIQELAVASIWVALTSLSHEAKKKVIALEFPGSLSAHALSPSQLSDIEKQFSAQLVFSSTRLAVSFQLEMLDLSIPTVDPSLKLLLERKLRVITGEVLPEDSDELRSQVFAAILELRSAGQTITLEAVADSMGAKPESLSYALRTHKISLQKLKAAVEP